MPHFEERNYKGILENIDLTEDMVLKKLKKLKVNKSPGPDAIHPRVIQEIAESITVPITLIFKTSLQLKELPDQWKHASVCAIFKKGNKTKPQNYRPVSLTSIICKTLESLVRDHIIEHMKLNNLFSEKQFGFISGDRQPCNCSTYSTFGPIYSIREGKSKLFIVTLWKPLIRFPIKG